MDFVVKVQLTVVVDDDLTAKVMNMLKQTANTGKIGDGKI